MIDNVVKIASRYGSLFLQGTGYTLALAAITVFFGALIGTLIAMLHRSRFRIPRVIAGAYTEILRGTPLLLQLYFFYFLMPELLPGLNLSKFVCCSVALVINSSAYVSEIVRGGIEAVDKGQTEAARSLGMSSRQTMMRIILPQAIKNILPALCNEFVTVIKETSLASTFFVGDLMTTYKTISGAMYMVIEPLIVVGIIYFLLTFSLSKLIKVFERRLKASD